MVHSRRSILKNSGLVSLGAAVMHPTLALAKTKPTLFSDGYPDRKEIISAAVDSAVAAGATYVDARLTHLEAFGILKYMPPRTENMAFGVRALYKGYWGFAASPVWSKEEAARLGAAAVAQAKANVLGRERITELAPIIDPSNGHWATPVKHDPFKIDSDELLDFVDGLTAYIGSLKYMGSFTTHFGFNRINKAFGNSSGQFNTQTLYGAGAAISFSLEDKTRMTTSGGQVEGLSPAGEGYEYFRDRPIREYVRMAHEEALADLALPVKPVDVGRYNVLVDQHGMGSLLSQSIGAATEVDRVFGYEANAGGTSYINEPETMLGSLKIGSPLLNVSSDRSQLGSIGRVKWDDEGVAPVKYDLIKDGVLVNLQTNREGASWIKDHYDRSGQQFRSFGSATAPSALDVQLVHKADLSLKPSDASDNSDTLRASLGDGLEFRMPKVTFDFQQITGLARGRTYEIKKGKRVARLKDAGMVFRTSELWTNLTAIGGSESVKYNGIDSAKGQPEQSVASAVYTPPATFKEMTFIDVTRKG